MDYQVYRSMQVARLSRRGTHNMAGHLLKGHGARQLSVATAS